MARYRITFALREPIPFEVSRSEITIDGTPFCLVYDSATGSLSVADSLGSDHGSASVEALEVANQFLNYLFARTQFPGEVLTGYKYENLDDNNDRGQVAHVKTVIAYGFQGKLPEHLDLSTDRRGAAFVRRGDLAGDPFDRFRNYYLAVDCIGKSLRTTKDSRIIAETLSTAIAPAIVASLNQDLAKVRVPDSITISGDPIEDINAVLYHGFRCALMHSGATSDFTPFNASDEAMVVSALRVMRGVAWQYVKFHESNAPTI